MSHRNALAALALAVLGFACTGDDPLTAPARTGDHQASGIQSETTLAPLYLAASDVVQTRPDHYIVKLKDELVPKDSAYFATAGILASTQAESQKIWPTFRGFYARIPSDEVDRLRQHRLVEYIEEDQTVLEDYVPSGLFDSGTQTSAPWHLDRIDQDSYPLDGNYTYDSSGDGVRIYVIDSGFARPTMTSGAEPVTDTKPIATGIPRTPTAWGTARRSRRRRQVALGGPPRTRPSSVFASTIA